MKLLNKIEENNYITEAEHPKHTIKKYEFRSIQKEPELVNAIEETGIYTPHESLEANQGISQGQFETLLKAYESLEAKMQSLIEEIRAQKQKEENALAEAKALAYQQGALEAEQKTKESLGAEMQKQQEVMVFSIQNLDNALKHTKEQIENIQSDLSVIALDLTKEVILKEVSQDAQEIALNIAKELLRPIEKSTKMTLRVNPSDLPFLQEKLSNLEQLEFKADLSISRGGVILESTDGSFDGTILARYRHLKQSLLDEKGL